MRDNNSILSSACWLGRNTAIFVFIIQKVETIPSVVVMKVFL